MLSTTMNTTFFRYADLSGHAIKPLLNVALEKKKSFASISLKHKAYDSENNLSTLLSNKHRNRFKVSFKKNPTRLCDISPYFSLLL